MSQPASSSVEQHSGATKQESAAVANVVPLQDSVAQERFRDYQSIERGDKDSLPPSCLPRVRCYRQKATLMEHLLFFCALSVASYAGVLVRLYLSLLAQWNGVPLFPSLYAEVIGTLIMGLVTSHKLPLEKRHKVVYQGIATGFCGSITSFSSWSSEAVATLLQINDEEAPVDNAMRVVGWITTILLGVTVPVGALTVGRHLSTLSPWSDGQRRGSRGAGPVGEDDSDTARNSTSWRVIEGFIIFVAWIMSSTLVVILTWSFDRLDLLFTVLFAAIGTYVRWHLSPLNSATKYFKLGTFIANVSGSWILAATLLLQTHLGSTNALADDALVGMATGLCGCLTTVSTFVVELGSLPLGASYLYGASSILVAHAGLVVVRGGYIWSR